MKILLVMPDASIRALRLGEHIMSFREAPLTMTSLAALIPEELGAEIEIIDESIQTMDFDKYKDFDLVGISALTGTSVRAFEIADKFRAMGITVVLGGVHVTIMPEEAVAHSDSIVIGFAEQVWPRLLHDFKAGNLQKRYESDKEDLLEGYPMPRRDLQKKFGYALPNTIMATRGCSNKCDFCTVPVYIKGYHKRPIPEIIAEIRTIKGRRFGFNDVSLVEDPEWTKLLLKALIPLKKKWGGLSTFHIYKDKEMMKLLKQSGCTYLLVGLESISQQSLGNIYKGFNRVDGYAEGMKVFHDHGIVIQGCFVFGFDQDDKDVFARTVDQVQRLKIDIPRYSIYTPYPGTTLYKRLEQDNRILTRDYQYYDTQHVVFHPKILSPEDLYAGFKWAYKETFKLSSIFQRTMRSSLALPVTFVGNLAYRIYVKELYRTQKFEDPKFYEDLAKNS